MKATTSSLFLLLFQAGLWAQQPILYHRGAVNAASLAPFGLPNAPIARGSVFSVFGENLGPTTPQTVPPFHAPEAAFRYRSRKKGTTTAGVSWDLCFALAD